MKHPGGRPKKSLQAAAAEKLAGRKEFYTVEEVAAEIGRAHV